ncbi:hypothetical protein [Streptomyces sp. NPDC048659]|uniref:hypothetical protein n=1 Tax=Streptomyces sp. NPDC048659 TaxID=3155489 RepID=UPI003443B026
MLRPVTVVVPAPEGLFIRSPRGEYTLRAPALGRAWPSLAAHLESGAVPELLPGSLVEALLGTGAAVQVPAALAGSELPWHRYALAWAANPAAAVDRIATARWEVSGGPVETGAVRAAAHDWGLAEPGGTASPAGGGHGLRLVCRGGGGRFVLRLVARDGVLVVERADGGLAPEPLPGGFAPPVRAVAAAAALHAGLVLASGPGGWEWPGLPVTVDPRTLTLTGADGTSSR